MKKLVVDTVAKTTKEIELTPEEEVEFEASRETITVSPEGTPTRPDDIERALLAKGVIAAADIAIAKRSRP